MAEALPLMLPALRGERLPRSPLKENVMAVQSAFTGLAQGEAPTVRITLLELVTLLSEVTESEEATVGMARALVASGKVQLTGSFKDRCHDLLV
jgi:hypothetical protein